MSRISWRLERQLIRDTDVSRGPKARGDLRRMSLMLLFHPCVSSADANWNQSQSAILTTTSLGLNAFCFFVVQNPLRDQLRVLYLHADSWARGPALDRQFVSGCFQDARFRLTGFHDVDNISRWPQTRSYANKPAFSSRYLNPHIKHYCDDL